MNCAFTLHVIELNLREYLNVIQLRPGMQAVLKDTTYNALPMQKLVIQPARVAVVEAVIRESLPRKGTLRRQKVRKSLKSPLSPGSISHFSNFHRGEPLPMFEKVEF